MEPATNKEVIEIMTGIKQKLLLIGVPVLLVGGGLSLIAASCKFARREPVAADAAGGDGRESRHSRSGYAR